MILRPRKITLLTNFLHSLLVMPDYRYIDLIFGINSFNMTIYTSSSNFVFGKNEFLLVGDYVLPCNTLRMLDTIHADLCPHLFQILLNLYTILTTKTL